MRGKRGKLICEMNQLLIYEKSEKYSVYSPCNRNCLLQGTCLEMAKEFARHFTKFIALPLSEDSRKYLSRYIELTDDILLSIGKHAMRFQIPCEICAHYTDMEDFFSDWTALGYSRTEARKLMHGGIGDIRGVIVGVLIYGLINNMLSLYAVTKYWQELITGLIMLIAVLSQEKAALQ